MNERKRGVIGWVMPEEVNGPKGFSSKYVLVANYLGELRMVNTEGVGYEVDDHTPWCWTDYDETARKWSPEELIALTDSCEEVDLADWIRVFGARLESNFHIHRRWATQ